MAVYSITDLAKLTGIKAHTLRIWEKRYNILSPGRTATNMRYYSDDDLRKISGIAMLTQRGYKISHLTELPVEEMESLLANVTDSEWINAESLDAFTLCVLQLDEKKFVHLLDTNIEQLGFDEMFSNILMPLLDKMHSMWLSGAIKKIHQEFLIQIIKKKLYQAIAVEDKKTQILPIKFLIFLPPRETQELSCIFLIYALKKKGIQVLDAGSDINTIDLYHAVVAYDPQFIASFVQEKSSNAYIEDFLRTTADLKNHQILLLSGYYAQDLMVHQDVVRVMQSFDELEDFISTIIPFSSKN